jgi:hypothetical protein
VNEIDLYGLARWPDAACQKILDKISRITRDLEDKLSKYDPTEDAKGGHPYNKGGLPTRYTQPGSHFRIIEGLQRSLAEQIQRLQTYCDDYDDPPGKPQMPQRARDLLNVKVPPPVARQNRSMTQCVIIGVGAGVATIKTIIVTLPVQSGLLPAGSS